MSRYYDPVTHRFLNADEGKVLNKLGILAGVAATAVDVGAGIYDNVQNNASFGKIAYNVCVDATFTGGGIAIGSIIGSAICPGLGTLAGAAVDLVISFGVSYITDVWAPNGKTLRENAKGLVS